MAEPVVLVHGWGAHSQIWGEIPELDRPVLSLDLPGHGKRPRGERMLSLDHIGGAPRRAVYVGWSLGGAFALHRALSQPERVAALVLVAASPCFVAQAHWPHGMNPDHFHRFTELLEDDHIATLERFAALEVHGSEHSREQLRELQRRMHAVPPPARRTLRDGLHLLEHTDLSARLGELNLPCLVVGGNRDRLVSPASVDATADRIPGARAVEIAGAGHAPFISRPQVFWRAVHDFLETLP